MKGLLLWLGPILIIYILFRSSNMTYHEQSLLEPIARILADEPFKEQLSKINFSYAGVRISIFELGYPAFIEFFIRKFAHFSIFFLFSVFTFIAVYYFIKSRRKASFISLLLSAVVAMLDEYHQTFTPHRSGMWQDVCLDIVGAIVGLLIVNLIYYFKEKKKTRGHG